MDALVDHGFGVGAQLADAQDPLEGLLAAMSVRPQAFAVCEVKAGWRLVFDALPVMTVHYVLRGRGTLRTGDGSEVPYSAGSIIIAPAGLSKSFGDDGGHGETRGVESCALLDRGFVKFTSGGDGEVGSLMICGALCAGAGGDLGLFGHLRTPIVEQFGDGEALPRLFELLLGELATPGIGSQALVEALMKQCFVLLLRRKLQRGEVDTPLFAALRDSRMMRTVAEILAQPAAPHTVESLARTAGMSRSPFAERFTRTFGKSPIEFVQKLRLRMGAQLLETTNLPVKTIATSVGYLSRSYFSRAFCCAYGVDPTTYRARAERTRSSAASPAASREACRPRPFLAPRPES